MRNLKKILAVVLAVALLATMSVTALAAVANETQANALKAIGLFKGTTTGLNLEGNLPRIQAMILTIRARGEEAAALALTQAEIDEQLAKVEDGATLAAWEKPYAAYALKIAITNGVGVNGKAFFKAQDPITGTLFTTLLLRAMGYADVDYTNPWATAVSAGLTSAISVGMKSSLIRDDAVGLLYAMVKTGKNADGKTFIQTLIDKGAVDQATAAAQGFCDVPTPEALKVLSVTTNNLKQLVVSFNMEIKEAGDEDNYELDADNATITAGSDFALQADKKTVVITLTADAAQQEVVDLTVKDIEAVSGATFVDQTISDIELFDNTIPSAVSAEVVGKYTIKVIFSEPIETITADDFTVDGGDIVVQGVAAANDARTAFNVTLYSALENGTIKIEAGTGIKDYATYGIAKKAFTVPVTADTTAPVVVGYKDADPDSVTLIFDQDIQLADGAASVLAANFYHTNTSNPVDAAVVPGDISGNELTLDFSTNTLPAGTAYIYIEKEVLEDLWENENAKVAYTIQVTLDTTKPTLDKVEQGDNEAEAVLTFSEDLDNGTATDESNYTLLDKDGKVVEDGISGAALSDTDEVTITFSDDLSGDYSIVVEAVEDEAGNAISKVTKTFKMTDSTAPDLTVNADLVAKIYNAGVADQMIKVIYAEAMAVTGAYSIVDLDKYSVAGINLADIDDVTIKAVDGNKAVEIKIPDEDGAADGDLSDGQDFAAGDEIIIGRVADAAGNKTALLSNESEHEALVASGTVDIDTVELTKAKTVVVTLTDKLTTFKANDFIIYADTNVATPNGYDAGEELAISKVSHTINSDNVSVITFTLADGEYDDTFVDRTVGVNANDLRIATVAGGSIDCENIYGEPLEAVYNDVVDDKAAPTIVDDEIDYQNATTIVITLSEDIDAATYLAGAMNGFSVSGGDAELTTVVVAGDTITLTGTDFTANTNVSYNSVFGLADADGNKLANITRTDALD